MPTAGCGQWLLSTQEKETSQIAMTKVWRCLCEILAVPVGHDEAQVIASLSFSAGGSSAFRSRSVAHSASWADCMRMVRQRHPDIAEFMMTNFADGAGPCFVSEGVNSRSLRLGWRCHRGQSCQSPHLSGGELRTKPTQGVANIGRSTTRFVEIPTWAVCFRPFDTPPDLQSDKDRGAAIRDPVPMWPPT